MYHGRSAFRVHGGRAANSDTIFCVLKVYHGQITNADFERDMETVLDSSEVWTNKWPCS
jgi:hypothetical protein